VSPLPLRHIVMQLAGADSSSLPLIGRLSASVFNLHLLSNLGIHCTKCMKVTNTRLFLIIESIATEHLKHTHKNETKESNIISEVSNSLKICIEVSSFVTQ